MPGGEEMSLRPQPEFLFLTDSPIVTFLFPASVSLSVTSEICSLRAAVLHNPPAISARRELLQRSPSITSWIRSSPSKHHPPSFPTLPSSHHWNSFFPCPAACLSLLLHHQDIQKLAVTQEQSGLPSRSPHLLRDAEKPRARIRPQSTETSPQRAPWCGR